MNIITHLYIIRKRLTDEQLLKLKEIIDVETQRRVDNDSKNEFKKR